MIEELFMTVKKIFYYITTLVRSDLFLATLCASQLATWRQKEGDDAAFPDRIQGMNRMMYVEGNPMKYGDISGNRISTPLAWGLMGAAWATQNGHSAEEGFILGYMHGRGLQKQKNNNDLDRALGTGNLFHGIQYSNFGNWLTKVYGDIRRKPFELTDKRALRKEEDAHKRRSVGCAAYFGFGSYEYADCFGRSYALRTKNRTDIKIKNRWFPGYDHATGEPLVQFAEAEYVEREIIITFIFRCGIPSALSTPHCPSKEEKEKEKEK